MSRKRRNAALSPPPAPAAGGTAGGMGSVVLGLVALLGFTAWIYAPVRGFEFVTWDDGPYVTENSQVLAGLTWRGLHWALGAQVPYWHPLTWLSHMLDVQLFGADAGAHHLVNVLLHLTNTVVLFWLLNRLTSRAWLSLIVAALFAVHPLHVESVAWVAERKDLLSSLFALLTMVAYSRHVASRGRVAYALFLLCFCLSLMSKPMFVTMPVLLLLIDWWPLKREMNGARVWEKLPLAALSVIVSVATYLAQGEVGTMAGLTHLSLGSRLANAAISCMTYLQKAFWPIDLSAFYPYPEAPLPGWRVAASVAALLTISVGAWALRRFRYVGLGWMWFLVVLSPVIGVIQVGNQARADRFTYMALVGISIAMVWSVAALADGYRSSPALAGPIAVGAVLFLGLTARAQVMTWRDSETLWSRVLSVTPDSFYAHSALGVELAKRNDLAGARREQAEALRLRPDDPDANNELGILLARAGDFDTAISRFTQALAANPGFEEAQKNLARAHFDRGTKAGEKGDIANALVDFESAAAADQSRPEFKVSAALALISLGRPGEAVGYARAAQALDPDNQRLKELLAQLERR